MINSYSFGQMTINGKRYSADLIIYPDGTIQDSWWRRQGHRLAVSDIADLIASQPAFIIAGSGASGLMRPEPDLAATLARQGIKLVIEPTAQAVHTFNRLRADNPVGGCFHLTC